MSQFLDQLFGNAQSPLQAPVETDNLSAEEWASTGLGLAIHQAMQGGFDAARSAGRIVSRPRNVAGKIDLQASLNAAIDYQAAIREALIDSQVENMETREIAQDVFDGGIKKGSRLLIRIIPERQTVLESSLDEVVRKEQASVAAPDNLVFDKLSVQSISEPDQERHQILETLGADLIYGFGRRPRRVTINGMVLNGRMDVRVAGAVRSMDWANAFKRRYNRHYRLDACLENRKRVFVHLQDTVYIGYLLQMSEYTSAQTQAAKQISLQMVLAERKMPRQNDAQIPGWVNEQGQVNLAKQAPEEFLKPASLSMYFEQNIEPEMAEEREATQARLEETLVSLARLLEPSAQFGQLDGLDDALEQNDLPEEYKSTSDSFVREAVLLVYMRRHLDRYAGNPDATRTLRGSVDYSLWLLKAGLDGPVADVPEEQLGQAGEMASKITSLGARAVRLWRELKQLEST